MVHVTLCWRLEVRALSPRKSRVHACVHSHTISWYSSPNLFTEGKKSPRCPRASHVYTHTSTAILSHGTLFPNLFTEGKAVVKCVMKFTHG